MNNKRSFLAVFLYLLSGSSFSNAVSEELAKYCLAKNWPKAQQVIKSEDLAKLNKEARKVCVREAFCDSSSSLFPLFLSLNNDKLPSLPDSCILSLIKISAEDRLQLMYDHGQKIPKLIEEESPLWWAQNNERSTKLTSFLLYRLGLKTINRRSPYSGRTPLGEAFARGFFESARILIENGADFVRALYARNAANVDTIIENTVNDVGIAKLWLLGNYHLPSLLSSNTYSLKEKNILLEFLLRAHDGDNRVPIQIAQLKFQTSQLGFREAQPLKKAKKITKEQCQKEFCIDLCEEGAQTVQRLESCGHAVCYDCTRASCNFQLSELNLPACPINECGCPLSKEDCEKFALSEIGVLKAQKKLLENNLSAIKSYYPCPYRDCPGGGYKILSLRGSPHSKCQVCGLNTCVRCHESHVGKSCGKFENIQREDLLKSSGNVIKPCPQCSWLIEKNQGCDHMQCLKCNHEFYWSSLKKYQRP